MNRRQWLAGAALLLGSDQAKAFGRLGSHLFGLAGGGKIALTANPLTQLVPGTTYTSQNFTAPSLGIAAGSGAITCNKCKFTANAASQSVVDTGGYSGALTLAGCEMIGSGLAGVQGNMGVWNRSPCRLEVKNCYLHEFGQTINLNGATGVNYIHDNTIQHLLGGAGTHYEALYYGGGGGAGFSLDMENNTLINEQIQTAAIFIETEFGDVNNITINNNFCAILGGGDWPIAIDGHNYNSNISNVTITNNTMKMAAGSQFFNIRPPAAVGTLTNLTMSNNVSAVSGFQIWSGSVTYALNQVIEGWDGWLYKSLQAGNLNNAQPNSGGSTAWWSSSGLPGFVG